MVGIRIATVIGVWCVLGAVARPPAALAQSRQAVDYERTPEVEARGALSASLVTTRPRYGAVVTGIVLLSIGTLLTVPIVADAQRDLDVAYAAPFVGPIAWFADPYADPRFFFALMGALFRYVGGLLVTIGYLARKGPRRGSATLVVAPTACSEGAGIVVALL